MTAEPVLGHVCRGRNCSTVRTEVETNTNRGAIYLRLVFHDVFYPVKTNSTFQTLAWPCWAHLALPFLPFLLVSPVSVRWHFGSYRNELTFCKFWKTYYFNYLWTLELPSRYVLFLGMKLGFSRDCAGGWGWGQICSKAPGKAPPPLREPLSSLCFPD